MNSTQKITKVIGVILTIMFLTGCATSITPVPPPTFPLPPPPKQTIPPPSPQRAQPTQTTQPSLLKLIQTVQVTNEHFSNGVGSDIAYIPSTDRIAVIMSNRVDQPITLSPSEVCDNTVIGYLEYTKDMQPTEEYGYLSCGFADIHAMNIGNDVYLAKMKWGGPGYTLEKYDGVTWKRLASRDVNFDNEKEWGVGGGPDVSFINGNFVVTGEYVHGGTIYGGTHNMIFTTDLVFVKTVLLSSPGVPFHHGEYSLLQLFNGDILLFASASPSENGGPPPKGNLEVLRFDKDWHFLEQKWLRDQAHYPTGSANDGRYTYISYSTWGRDTWAGQNEHLAAFDAQWNLIQDVTLTDVQSISDLAYGEQSMIILRGNRLYVFYDILSKSSNSVAPDYTKSRTYVAVFELNQKP
jgi:hypothetical protein